MLKYYWSLFFIVLFSLPGKATDFQAGNSIVISTPQWHDLYIAGGTVKINAPVYGDLIVLGGDVTINDSIMADVMVAGGKIILNGYVADDVRCGGGRVNINGYVGGDIVVGGGEVFIGSKTSASGIVATGGEVKIAGESRNNLIAEGGDLFLTGKVNGDLVFKGGTITVDGSITGGATLAASKDIKITKSAHIGRGIQYWLPLQSPLIIPKGVSATKPVYDPLLSITHSRWYFLGASTFLGLMWYLGMAFILILVIQYLFSVTLYRAGIKCHSRPARSLLTGLAYLVCLPIASALLLVTVVGLPLTVLSLIFYAISIILATVISSVVIVNWVSFISGRDYSLMKTAWTSLFVFSLLKIITFTPFFGSVIMIAIASTAFGSILLSIKWKPIKTAERRIISEKVTHF
jgi:hypothetical protein